MEALIAMLAQIAVEKGLPVAVQLLLDWKEDRVPTAAEIRARADALPPPEDFG